MNKIDEIYDWMIEIDVPKFMLKEFKEKFMNDGDKNANTTKARRIME